MSLKKFKDATRLLSKQAYLKKYKNPNSQAIKKLGYMGAKRRAEIDRGNQSKIKKAKKP